MQPSMRPSNAPSRYGRYEVLFRIAAGGMAEVYVARLVGEGGFEKLVALKRMLPTLAEDERFVNMFLDEGKVAANISSPHVVSTLDMGRAEDDSLYLVMELVVGVSLSALLRVMAKAGEIVPVDVAVELLAQAAMGLEDAHEARTIYGEPLGIVHRDISPQNVLIDVSGRVRITDFGVARALARVTQTQSGEVKGKLAYFAPEQARSKPLDRRADVYALGIVGWELLAGRRLFAGEGPADTLLNVLEMPAPALHELRPEVPVAVSNAIAHALQRDLSLRTASAGELAAELRAATTGSGAAALGRFVRARGGESLLRLEEGIRSLVPSAPSIRLTSPSGPQPRLPLPDVADDAGGLRPDVEELTTRTPSVSQVLDVKSAVIPVEMTGALVAAAPPPSPPAPSVAVPSVVTAAPSPVRRGWLLPALGAGVLGAVAFGGWLAMRSDDRSIATPLPLPASAPISPAGAPSETLAPPAVAGEATAPVGTAAVGTAEPDRIAEPAEPDGLADETAEGGGVDGPTRPRDRRDGRGRVGGSDTTTTTTTVASERSEPRGEEPRGGEVRGGESRGSDGREGSGRASGAGRTPGPGTSGLRGMDDFESELGPH